MKNNAVKYTKIDKYKTDFQSDGSAVKVDLISKCMYPGGELTDTEHDYYLEKYINNLLKRFENM